MKKSVKFRCPWAEEHEAYKNYHDMEWGRPIYDDHRLFEFLVLSGAQAGLSWITILKRREGYQKAFSNFDLKKIARFNGVKIEKLMLDPDIIRNRSKINSVITNAKILVELQKEYGSFSHYLWSFVDDKPIKNRWKRQEDAPARTELSDQLSKDLKNRGFKFVGSTVCYAFLQTVGVVNDHIADCCYGQ